MNVLALAHGHLLGLCSIPDMPCRDRVKHEFSEIRLFILDNLDNNADRTGGSVILTPASKRPKFSLP